MPALGDLRPIGSPGTPASRECTLPRWLACRVTWQQTLTGSVGCTQLSAGPSLCLSQPQPPLPHKPTLRERAAADYTLRGRLHRRVLQALDIQTRWCPLAAAGAK